MFYQGIYKNKDNKEIEKSIRNEGFDPVIIKNNPGYVYEKHSHLETKLLVFIEGSMRVSVDNKRYICFPGDKLVIPGNTLHEAVVGDEGCAFFWAEKLDN